MEWKSFQLDSLCALNDEDEIDSNYSRLSMMVHIMKSDYYHYRCWQMNLQWSNTCQTNHCNILSKERTACEKTSHFPPTPSPRLHPSLNQPACELHSQSVNNRLSTVLLSVCQVVFFSWRLKRFSLAERGGEKRIKNSINKPDNHAHVRVSLQLQLKILCVLNFPHFQTISGWGVRSEEFSVSVNLFTCGQAEKIPLGNSKLLFEEWHLCQRINLRFSLSR